MSQVKSIVKIINGKKHQTINLSEYAPGYLTWIANKLSRGASQDYLKVFGIGIETWRLLVLLAIENTLSAQHVSKVIGMDKASVSRCFKKMTQDGLITLSLDPLDGRLRMANLTAKGRELHDQVLELALVREQAFLSALTESEQVLFLDFLRRLHENLSAVDQASAAFLQQHYPQFSTQGAL